MNTLSQARLSYSIVMRGLDPRIHPLRKKSLHLRWIAGSSPAMTSFEFGGAA
jgi:hypothetical protein